MYGHVLHTLYMDQLETLINQSIKSREMIRDNETVLKLLWLDAANMELEPKGEKLLEILFATC